MFFPFTQKDSTQFRLQQWYSVRMEDLSMPCLKQLITKATRFRTPKKQVYRQQNKRNSFILCHNSNKQINKRFFITYNEQSVALHTMVMFHLQYDPAYHNKVYIEFKLNSIKYKIEPGLAHAHDMDLTGSGSLKKSSLIVNRKKVVVDVDKRRIYINNIFALNSYKRVNFAQCEYFSNLDVYISSCFLGTQFRLQKYQFSEFYCFDNKQKIDFHVQSENHKLSLSNGQKGNMIAKATGLTVQQFYLKFRQKIYKAYKNLRNSMIQIITMHEQDNSYTAQRQQIKQIINHEVIFTSIAKKKQQLSNQYQTDSLQDLYLQIYKQIVQFQQYVCYLWRLNAILMQMLSYKFFSNGIQKCLSLENTKKQKCMVVNTKIDSSSRKIQHLNFLKRRQEIIESLDFYQQDDIYHPFIMLENYSDQKERNPSGVTHQITSLVVFVHGYQGSDYDLEKAKNFLTAYSNNVYGLLIKSIQDEIDQNIEHLGQKVAQQIKSHISSTVNVYKKISILGYSLGGVVARQAIKHLSQYKQKMNMLVTFASPHLGVSVNENKLVGTGIWYLINFEKVKNLKQLNCQKTSYNMQQIITLDKLSDCQCLSWFKKFVVVSSQQDNFVPYHSSRISQIAKNQNISNMAQKIMSRAKRIERVQVWFDVDHDINTFDKMLGRRAHIQFLQNRIFLDLFFRLYAQQF